MKKGLYPFINRASSNIYNRIYYYKRIVKFLNIIKTKKNKYCLVPDKNNENVYYIGNIKLKKQIGSESINGMVFLASFQDKLQKIYKYAVKLSKITTDKLEIEMFKLLSNAVITKQSPHFPIMYGNTSCLSFTPNPKLPKLLIDRKINKYELIYMELANGDLKSIIYSNQKQSQAFYINTLVQCIMSLIFFYHITGKIHGDANSGNFLYHKIKSGGYFHYKIFGKDYYLENIGYLWMLWDYEFAKQFIYVSRDRLFIDFYKILNLFIPYNEGGLNKAEYFINDDNKLTIKSLKQILLSKNANDNINKIKFSNDILNYFSILILNYFEEHKYILTSLPLDAEVINKKPYEITKILFK